VLIDGSRPDAFDPDTMAVAVVARDLGIRTNNVAEYAALVLALREAELLGAQEIDLRLDSKLIVEQLNGRWRVKDAKLQGLFAEAVRRLGGLQRWTAVHEPRARNRAADALANMALDDPFGAERVIAEVRRKADAS
jgi:ribonuclease H / adenosylcobalamin/alpha-ribazole phosphatase